MPTTLWSAITGVLLKNIAFSNYVGSKSEFFFVQLKSQAKQNITASHHVFESHMTSTFYHKEPFELKEISVLFIR